MTMYALDGRSFDVTADQITAKFGATPLTLVGEDGTVKITKVDLDMLMPGRSMLITAAQVNLVWFSAIEVSRSATDDGLSLTFRKGRYDDRDTRRLYLDFVEIIGIGGVELVYAVSMLRGWDKDAERRELHELVDA